jgi:DNA repair protein RadC
MIDAIREHVVNIGSDVASEHDILSLVCGSEGLAKKILAAFGPCLAGLRGRTEAELVEVGASKPIAARILASIELGTRIGAPPKGPSLSTAGSVAAYVADMAGRQTESFVVVALNSRNQPVGRYLVARGWESGVNLNPNMVFRAILKNGATRVVLVHNHPSGDPTPSPEDIRFTRRILDAARLLEVQILDHVVVAGDGGFRSLRESCYSGDLMFG